MNHLVFSNKDSFFKSYKKITNKKADIIYSEYNPDNFKEEVKQAKTYLKEDGLFTVFLKETDILKVKDILTEIFNHYIGLIVWLNRADNERYFMLIFSNKRHRDIKKYLNGFDAINIDNRIDVVFNNVIEDLPINKGKEDLDNILGPDYLESVFGNNNYNPKPVKLFKKLIKLYNKKDLVFLDYNSGTGTAAQAIIELNQEDNGTRTFILNTEDFVMYDNIIIERIKKLLNKKNCKYNIINCENQVEKYNYI